MKLIALLVVVAVAFAEQRALLSARLNASALPIVPNQVTAGEVIAPTIHNELSNKRVHEMATRLDMEKTQLVDQYNYIKGLKNQYDNDAKIYKENVDYFDAVKTNVASNIEDHATATEGISPAGLPFEAAAYILMDRRSHRTACVRAQLARAYPFRRWSIK